MKMLLAIAVLAVLAVPSQSFIGAPSRGRWATKQVHMVATETKVIAAVDAPDFYWQYRLERLKNKKGGDLTFKAQNYPEVSGYRDLYDAYYLDLTLQGKLEGFDWEAEKEISDAEWLTIFDSISKWSEDTAAANKPDVSNLPASDFDLLKQFYPQLDMREMQSPFSPEEVGSDFPYSSMKAMLDAASAKKLSVPGYSSVTSLDTSDAKKELAALKESAMKTLDSVRDDAMKFANMPFPDEESRTHYKALKETLGNFPQGDKAWADFAANMKKEVDEMARLASKRVDVHHHHGEDAVTPAQEFEAKYGRSLEEMQERMSQYKSDPVGFLEGSIIAKHGQEGLEVWKKSQEFSAKRSVMSADEVAAVEKKFADFLSQA